MSSGFQGEQDFPAGHPSRFDYNPASPEAIEYARRYVLPLGERDFPVDHPAASDTPGHKNTIAWAPGVDPLNPHLEPFTGRTPEQVAGVRALSETASQLAKESPVAKPVDAHIVAAAMEAKRKAVGRDVLNEDEYREVMAGIHAGTTVEVVTAEVKANIERQHEALAYLISKGFTRAMAMGRLARDGAVKILAERDAANTGV